MRGVALVVDDAAVFLHLKFVAVPIGTHAIAFAFGDVFGIDPESVVDGLVVVKGCWSVVGIEGEGNQ